MSLTYFGTPNSTRTLSIESVIDKVLTTNKSSSDIGVFAISGFQFNLVFLNHRIGEQLFAHRLELGFGLFGAASRQFQIDHLALAHFAHGLKAKTIKGMADGLALWIQNAIFQGNEDARFHDYSY